MSMEISDYRCRRCGKEYPQPKLNREGHTHWECPHCGAPESIHITPRRDRDRDYRA